MVKILYHVFKAFVEVFGEAVLAANRKHSGTRTPRCLFVFLLKSKPLFLFLERYYDLRAYLYFCTFIGNNRKRITIAEEI